MLLEHLLQNHTLRFRQGVPCLAQRVRDSQLSHTPLVIRVPTKEGFCGIKGSCPSLL